MRAFNDCKTELNTRTGWIDLKTGAISPHSPAKLFDKATDAGLPNKATEGDGGKLWDRFLKETFCGDLELIDYVQACIGYSVTGKINEEVMFICEGSGGNGKSIFLECINEVLGDYSSVIPIETLIDNNKAQRDGSTPSPDLASLKGKRFVMTTEPKKQVTIDDGIVKTVTGGTKLNVRMLHQNPIVFLPQFKIWWQSNGLPRIAIKEHSMLRRLIVIPFKNEVRGDAVDINLKSKLMKEKEFILKWCMRAWPNGKHGTEKPFTTLSINQRPLKRPQRGCGIPLTFRLTASSNGLKTGTMKRGIYPPHQRLKRFTRTI
ncbi:phage/plasmid primase, P4 family [Lactobacillus delbrueckii]